MFLQTQKAQTGPFIRTVGITRATMRAGLANVVYNMRRFIFLERLDASVQLSCGEEVVPDLLKTQIKSYPKNRQSNRQKLEITSQEYQATVLRSLHLITL